MRPVGVATRAGPRAISGVLRWCLANRHFLIAAAILLLTALAIRLSTWVEKMPVYWPEGVVVSEDFRLLSLPDKIGPFVKVIQDGEIGISDGAPDGEDILKDNEMQELTIGTIADKSRRKSRCSNWYVSRIYRDERIRDRRDVYAYWRLQLYYYTGMRDTVPHVPDRCLVAGGAQMLTNEAVTFHAPAVPAPWQEPVQVNQVRFSLSNPLKLTASRYVQYYVFSLNGRPERRWETVRLHLSKPWVRHCFFAKIQFAPLGAVEDTKEAARKAEEFASIMLPTILRALPTEQDVEELDKLDSEDAD